MKGCTTKYQRSIYPTESTPRTLTSFHRPQNSHLFTIICNLFIRYLCYFNVKWSSCSLFCSNRSTNSVRLYQSLLYFLYKWLLCISTSFWVCAHLKAGQNTLFCRFQPFFFCSNLFKWFHVWNHWKTSLNEDFFFATLQSRLTCKCWSTPWGGTLNLSIFGWFFKKKA